MSRFLLGALVGGIAGAAGGWLVATDRARSHDREVLATAAEHVESAPGPAVGEADQPRRRGGRGRRRADGQAGPPELSAADREMVWKGPPVKPPPRDVDFGAGGGGRALAQPEINAGIGGRRRQLTDCIIEARGEAELTARMKLKFLVEGDGRVTRVRVRAPAYLQERGLYDCARRVSRSMRFPATGVPTVVTLPFELAL